MQEEAGQQNMQGGHARGAAHAARAGGIGFEQAAASVSGFVPAYTPPASGSSARHASGPGARRDSDGLIRVRKKRRTVSKLAIIIPVAILALFAAVGAGLALYVSSLDSAMAPSPQEQEALDQVLTPVVATQGEEEPFYLLLLGSDARAGDTASRSDVTMLVRVDAEAATVSLISIPRDTMVTIDGSMQKINAAYALGGAAQAVQTVSEFAGVPISHYASVDFESLEKLVDDLGGVWVNVPESFAAGNGGMDFVAGEQRLTGAQALAFARERYNVTGGDFGRAQAQRMVVEAIIKQVLAAEPVQLPGLISQLASSVTTDLNVGDLIHYARIFQGSDTGATIYSAACPSYSLSIDGVSYVGTEFDEWRAMMQRVDAGLDPADEAAEIPEEQQANESLGAASNSAAPRDYQSLAESAGLTTDDVISVEGDER